MRAFVHVLSSNHVPTGIQKALSDRKWTREIKDEMDALVKNNTWTLVPLPGEKKTVG